MLIFQIYHLILSALETEDEELRFNNLLAAKEMMEKGFTHVPKS